MAVVAIVSAAVLGFGGLVVGSTIPRAVTASAVAGPKLVAMSEVVPDSMTADLAVTPKGWGTRFDWTCTYLSADWSHGAPVYDLVITDRDGTEMTVASWTATKVASGADVAGGLVASSRVQAAEIRSVEIRTGGVTLLRSAP